MLTYVVSFFSLIFTGQPFEGDCSGLFGELWRAICGLVSGIGSNTPPVPVDLTLDHLFLVMALVVCVGFAFGLIRVVISIFSLGRLR